MNTYSEAQHTHCMLGFIVRAKGDILLLQNQEGLWSIPAGEARPHESPEAAAQRILWKETQCVHPLGNYVLHEFPPVTLTEEQRLVSFQIYSLVLARRFSAVATGKYPRARWIRPSDLGSIELTASACEAIEQWRKMPKRHRQRTPDPVQQAFRSFRLSPRFVHQGTV